MAYQITSLPPTIDSNLSRGFYDDVFISDPVNYSSSFSSDSYPVVPLLICPASDFVRVYYDSSLVLTPKSTSNRLPTLRYSFYADFLISNSTWSFPTYHVFEWPSSVVNAFPYLFRYPTVAFYAISDSSKSSSCFVNPTLDYRKTHLGYLLDDKFVKFPGVTLDEKSEVWFTISAIFIFIVIVAVAIRLFIYPFWRKIKK